MHSIRQHQLAMIDPQNSIFIALLTNGNQHINSGKFFKEIYWWITCFYRWMYQSSKSAVKLGMREVPFLPSWLVCFLCFLFPRLFLRSRPRDIIIIISGARITQCHLTVYYFPVKVLTSSTADNSGWFLLRFSGLKFSSLPELTSLSAPNGSIGGSIHKSMDFYSSLMPSLSVNDSSGKFSRKAKASTTCILALGLFLVAILV